MRVAILIPISGSWSLFPSLLSDLRASLALCSEVEPCLWWIEDGGADRPQSWHSLNADGLEMHVIELQGHQGRNRSLMAALGYLVCEREETFDAYLLLDPIFPRLLRSLEPLFEAALRHPDSVVLAPGGPARNGPIASIARHGESLLLRGLCGQKIGASSAVLLPASAAEALCHSCYGASHIEATLRRLRLKTIHAGMAKSASDLNSIAAVSVFRDQALARAFRVAVFLSLASTVAAAFAVVNPLPGALLARAFTWLMPALMAALFGGLALMAMMLGVFSQALQEIRRWTPALDSLLIVRSVTRVKRQPYALPSANAFLGSKADQSAKIADS